MPSDKFVSRRGNLINMSPAAKGGAVYLLKPNISVKPEVVKGGDVGSNRIVGIISPPPPFKSIESMSKPTPPIVFQGGDLLNAISFAKNKNDNKRDNIKFVF